MAGIDQIEFKLVFDSWYNPIRNFLYYKTGDIQSAEDIAQDVFLKIWEKRDEIKKDSVKSLLYTIANNLFLNKIERQKVAFKFEQYYQPGKTTDAPDFDLEMKEFDNKLQKALADLDEKKRTVFLMNRIDGFTYKEIAGNLDITVKAVEKRMEKALAFLKMRMNVNL
jgi:RNA polymerase sigma-70 factor (family 1)